MSILAIRKHLSFVRRFANAENGVVTIEWVALGGAVLVGAITIGWLVLNTLKAPASSVGSNIASCESLAASTQGTTTGCP